MTPIQEPITGREDFAGVTTPVIDSRQARTRREYQSTTAAR